MTHLLGRRALPGPAQDGAHPRHQLAGRERLDQVVVGPQLQAEDAVDLVVARREEEDGHRAAGADLAADVEPVACAREADVEDDDPGVRLLEDLEALLAVAGQQHAVALAPQVEVHQVGDVRVVLDDDHRPVLRAHAPSLPSPAPELPRMCTLPHRTLTFAEHAASRSAVDGTHDAARAPTRTEPDQPSTRDDHRPRTDIRRGIGAAALRAALGWAGEVPSAECRPPDVLR